MSPDSADRVSDHGAQVVESVEPIEDVAMQDVDSPVGKLSRAASRESVKKRATVVKREPTSNDSDSDETNDCTAEDNDRGRQIDNVMDEAVASEQGTRFSQERGLPSYQKLAGGDSDSSTADSNSPASAESRAVSAAEQDENNCRKRKTPNGEPELQGRDGSAGLQPRKRSRKAINRAYLDVLNQEITLANHRSLSLSHEKMDERIDLPSSQIGVTVWTSIEKERFFEALSCLGRDNGAGIADRIGTKGEMEVRQYMTLLQDAITHRRQQNKLDPLGLEDFPAAFEISHECCQALELVADHIATRQERSEFAAEESKVGPDGLLHQENHRDLEEQAGDDLSKATALFRTRKWLSLSERFFMNAPTPEGSWQEVDGDPPGIWLTALDEFHTLALTLTRRLVAASHYMAATRIRAERGYRPRVRQFVKEKDVLAAIRSLGVPTHKPPLTDCIRRLGISVYNEPPKQDANNDLEPMSVTDIEVALDIQGPQRAEHLRHQMERVALSSDESSLSSDPPTESDAKSDSGVSSSGSPDEIDSEDEEEVRAEANEAILHSAMDAPQTKRDRQALHRRVKAERQQERYADAVDVQASHQEEIQMWSLLGQEPPGSLVNPGSPQGGRRLKLSVDASYTVGRDWRAKTRVLSEWEAHYLGT